MFNTLPYNTSESPHDNQWNTAIYTRISEEERNKSIVDSIANQKKILTTYALTNNLTITKIYEDDSFRGGSYDRPAFKEMINDNVVNISEAISKSEHDERQKQIDIYNTKIYKLQQEIDKIQKLIAGLYSDYKSEFLSLEDYQDMKQRFDIRRNNLIAEIDMVKDHIIKHQSNNLQNSKCINTFLKYEKLSQINRNVLIALVDEIFIEENKDITINFKFKDELKKYCPFLH